MLVVVVVEFMLLAQLVLAVRAVEVLAERTRVAVLLVQQILVAVVVVLVIPELVVLGVQA
jgi:hypothetical protein